MDDSLDYTLKHHSRAKHIRIKVNALGSVEVVAPPGISSFEVQNFVLNNLNWINRTRDKLKDHRLTDPDFGITPPNRIQLVALNQQFNVKYEKCANTRVLQDHNHLYVHANDDEQRCQLLNFWLQQTAKKHLVPWLQQFAKDKNFDVNRITVRAQKTRWGSCSAKKNININRNLLFLPEELVTYLFAHELSHLVHLNHSAKFWAHLQTLEPSYRELDTALNIAHKDVPLWALNS